VARLLGFAPPEGVDGRVLEEIRETGNDVSVHSMVTLPEALKRGLETKREV